MGFEEEWVILLAQGHIYEAHLSMPQNSTGISTVAQRGFGKKLKEVVNALAMGTSLNITRGADHGEIQGHFLDSTVGNACVHPL